MSSDRRNVERHICAFLGHNHGGQTSAERITEFDEAIRTGAGDVGENDVASIQFLKDFLIKSCVFVRLRSINDNNLKAKLAFNHWLDDIVEKILNGSKIRMFLVQQPDGECARRLKRFQQLQK